MRIRDRLRLRYGRRQPAVLTVSIEARHIPVLRLALQSHEGVHTARAVKNGIDPDKHPPVIAARDAADAVNGILKDLR